MRILIVSDTHGDIDFFNEVITKEGRFDMVLHCGDGSGESDYFEKRADCPVYAVKGNCDIFSHESNTRIVTVAGKRLYMDSPCIEKLLSNLIEYSYYRMCYKNK